jgi:cytochrome c biogenesis protein CcmG/thiol:disulfide interchange protein DsbE
MLVALAYYYFKYVRKPNLELNEIEITSLDGDSLDIKQYLGKPLIVNFWATWCAPCIKELPHFEKIKRQYGDDIVFLLISEEDPAKILPYKNSFDFDFVLSAKSFEDYGVNSWPTTYFYNSSGDLVDKHNSSLTLKSLEQYIAKIVVSSPKD